MSVLGLLLIGFGLYVDNTTLIAVAVTLLPQAMQGSSLRHAIAKLHQALPENENVETKSGETPK